MKSTEEQMELELHRKQEALFNKNQKRIGKIFQEDVFETLGKILNPYTEKKLITTVEIKDFYCDMCEQDFDSDEIDWQNDDIALCPNCQTKIDY